MRNLLVITQKVDENDDLLGFFVGWIKEFSKKFDKVFVITLAKGDYELPDNVFVYSLGKESGNSRILRIFNFYKFLFRLVPGSDGIFAHMSPAFVIASWPAAALFRKKIVLWYLHRSVTARLKLAEKFCYKVVTSTRESLSIKSGKIVELGHGVDIEKFKFDRKFDDLSSRPIEILSVGRISPIKNYETLIKAAEILKEKSLRFKIKIVGRPVMPYDFDYFEKLKKMAGDLRLNDSIEFVGFIPYSRITDYYKESDFFVNLAPTGGIDKAVLEAMASGSLILVSNFAFKKYLGGYDLFFEQSDPDDLARKVFELVNLPVQNTQNISDFLVKSVKEHHDLRNTINKISSFFK